MVFGLLTARGKIVLKEDNYMSSISQIKAGENNIDTYMIFTTCFVTSACLSTHWGWGKWTQFCIWHLGINFAINTRSFASETNFSSRNIFQVTVFFFCFVFRYQCKRVNIILTFHSSFLWALPLWLEFAYWNSSRSSILWCKWYQGGVL